MTQEGRLAVAAERSTDETGEVRPKRPGGGKVKPGKTIDQRELQEVLRDRKLYKQTLIEC